MKTKSILSILFAVLFLSCIAVGSLKAGFVFELALASNPVTLVNLAVIKTHGLFF